MGLFLINCSIQQGAIGEKESTKVSFSDEEVQYYEVDDKKSDPSKKKFFLRLREPRSRIGGAEGEVK